MEVKPAGLELAGFNDGEFDPGSERTLAARLKHASRANPASAGEAADG